MPRPHASEWIGAAIAIGLGAWMACSDAGSPTIPEISAGPPPASPAFHTSSASLARVPETAAQSDERPPWPECLHDAGGSWKPDDGSRCVPVLIESNISGWTALCARNTSYFPNPSWRCCVDDGDGRCVPGSIR